MACFLFYILQQITRTFLQKRHIHKQFPRCILFQHNHWHHVLSLCVFFELWMVLGETEKCRSKEKHRVFHSRVSHTQTNAVNVNNKLQRILDQNLYREKHTHTLIAFNDVKTPRLWKLKNVKSFHFLFYFTVVSNPNPLTRWWSFIFSYFVVLHFGAYSFLFPSGMSSLFTVYR